ncbi:MAG: AAA ATPase [Methanoculleus marisnigri]|jgi:Predicted ATPase|uniref:AAA ATPase n=1 Tax=Methanoculleus marisnigri TaxID=2198 RepID=A0A101GRB8_9EURY|nr:MAG: AAA ATPase [Methanoculleus marisnigri]KUL03131.1 MAG: AAA ATPase [Methanoculleus marisnigri]
MYIIRRFWRRFRGIGVKGVTSREIGRHGPVGHGTGDPSCRGEAEAFPPALPIQEHSAGCGRFFPNNLCLIGRRAKLLQSPASPWRLPAGPHRVKRNRAACRVATCPEDPRRHENASAGESVSTDLTEALEAMGYADAEIPTLVESFPPAVIEYLRDFRLQEARDIIETLLYIYIAQNSSSSRGEGEGVVEQSCYAYTSGPLFALRQVDLIESTSWHGTTVIKATSAGEAISRPLMEARLQALDIGGLAREIHEVVPALLAGTVKGSFVNKTFPSTLPRTEETFVSFLLNNSPGLFIECERFAARLKAAGCAVLAYAYDLDGSRADGVVYTFPPEFAYILKGMLERIDPEVREHYDMLLESFYSTFTVLRYLACGEDYDRIRASPAHRRELTRVLSVLNDAIYVLEQVPQDDGVDLARFIVKDRNLYDMRLRDLGRALMADVAAKIVIDRPAPAPAAEEPLPPREEAPIVLEESAAIAPAPQAGEGVEEEEWDEPLFADDEEEEAEEEEEEPIASVPPPAASSNSVPRSLTASQTLDSRPSSLAPGGAQTPALRPVVPRAGGLDIFLGHAPDGRRVNWSPGQLNNGHMIILGGSGAGKTETIRCIASDLAGQGLPVVLIDFHGDMAASNGDIRSYKIREGGQYYFNPLELDSSIDEITPLRATSDFVDAISINFPTLGIQQRRKIKNIIKDCYRISGITGNTDTWTRVLDFDDIEGEIMGCEDEAIPAYLEDIFDYKLFSGEEKISLPTILSGGITHINLNALPENLRYLFADLFLRRIYYTLQATGEIPRGAGDEREKFRLFVIVDEAKLLVSQKSGSKTSIKAVLNKYATEMRKFGVSLILASQLIAHFNEEILANIAVKFCMRSENKKQAQENAKFFEVSEKDLLNFQPGEGILIIGSEKMNVRIVPSSGRNP